MGSSNYSDTVYSSRISSHIKDGTDIFTHTADVRAGRVAAVVNDKVDPAGKNKAGKVVRESRDSDVHPESVAVAVFFDETGSMGDIPRRFVMKLDKLMGALVKKGFLEHPHVLFGAFGDATNYEVAPLQVGQFEGGNEMDEALTAILLEGQGGGTKQESSELAMYFMARHAEMDCLEKRGKKGYMFLISDETPYDKVSASNVQRLIGDNLQEDIPTSSILEELREKFEVFWVRPAEGSYTHDLGVTDTMKKMFGQNWLNLEKAEDVVELIATTIGVAEGFDIHSVGKHLKDIGADAASVGRASTAVATYAGAKGIAKVATSENELVTTGDDNVTRL